MFHSDLIIQWILITYVTSLLRYIGYYVGNSKHKTISYNYKPLR